MAATRSMSHLLLQIPRGVTALETKSNRFIHPALQALRQKNSYDSTFLRSLHGSLKTAPKNQLHRTYPFAELQKTRTSGLNIYVKQLSTQVVNGISEDQKTKTLNGHHYDWIDKEASDLIQKAYSRHKALADNSKSFPPSLSVKDLEKIGVPYHYPPKDFIDRLALGSMKFLRVFVHAFFREKYDHHAVCLETVAAVPGLVGGFHRHLRSLRRMKRDHGWITVLQEEAENERMHLLIFMRVTKPTPLERALVVLAQGMYLTFYSGLYLVSPRAAHRLTGYLEEEAHRAYTEYLECIDNGKLKNKAAPEIAKKYYHLSDDATMRDVVLHVRADEAMHRDVNHHFGNKYSAGDLDSAVHALNSRELDEISKRQ